MSTFKNKKYIKLDYRAGFHKFSTVGDGSSNIH